MKIKQFAKPVVLIAASILFVAILAACSAGTGDQHPEENTASTETHEPEYREISMEPADEHEAYEPEEDLEIPDSDSNQQAEEPTAATPAPALAQSTPIPLTEARVESLTSFFAEFGGWFSLSPALGDYDIDSPDSIYAALEFVLSSRVFRHGREGILGYPHYGFVQYKGGQRFSWDDMPDGVHPMFEFITSDYVDSVLWSLFGITGFEHGTSEFTPTFGFQYHSGGYFYRALAQGADTIVAIKIVELYDNGNGAYSVVIEYVCQGWEGTDSVHMQYNMAVIQPFADTYQLLYWRNDVPRNTPIPVRQPIS